MREFKRTGSMIKVKLSDYEAALLESLVEQLAELLATDVGTDFSSDPFDRWQAEMQESEPLDRTDPAILRLFPDAYADDPVASTEFRRLTQSKQRSDRQQQAEVVLSALADCEGGAHAVQVRLIDLDDWLKTLTAVRLSLAARLGIETTEDAAELDALPDEDPRLFVYRVYEWIAYLSENLLSLA
ncbi:MAG: DUF2017 domain-containing protein [Propionicimonas sp.]